MLPAFEKLRRGNSPWELRTSGVSEAGGRAGDRRASAPSQTGYPNLMFSNLDSGFWCEPEHVADSIVRPSEAGLRVARRCFLPPSELR